MDNTPRITLDELAEDAVLLDVRDESQWGEGHAPSALHVPIAELASRLADLPRGNGPLVVTCGGGTKAGRATALLRDAGVDAVELQGGMRGWKAAGRPMVQD